jgi:pimeloyl-ACP methyl ester carboxylesterase
VNVSRSHTYAAFVRQLTATTILWLGAFRLSADSGKLDGLYYETKGGGDSVVLIHGGQMDRRMWDAQFDLFAKQYRVIRYDIRGFGKSDVPAKPYSDASDLHRLLQHLRVKKATPIGLSLGAAIAMDFALVHPEMVDSLIPVCPGLGGFPFQDKANDLRAVVEAARDESYEKAAELWLQNPYMSVAMQNPALRDKLRQLARDNAHCWLNNPMLIRRLKPSASERLREIHVRTLVIGGERDVSDIHQIVARLAAEIPGAQKEVLPGAGHLVPMERPEDFNRLTLGFLAKRHPK